MTDASFKDYLQEYIDIKGLSTKKLSDATGIPERYLEALIEAHYDILPPAPYVRGYIGKLAEVLDFDKEEMWRFYKRDAEISITGDNDRLPSNRYAVKTINTKLLVGGLLGILLIIYLGWNLNKVLGRPELKLIYPVTENLIVNQPNISIEGKVGANAKLTINNSEVFVDEDGRFQKDIQLNNGLNVIDVAAKKLLGQEVSLTRKIIYESPAPQEQQNIKTLEKNDETN